MTPLLHAPLLDSLPDATTQANSATMLALIVLGICVVAAIALAIGVLVHRKFFRGRLPRGEFRR